jgi:hypothetical protein
MKRPDRLKLTRKVRGLWRNESRVGGMWKDETRVRGMWSLLAVPCVLLNNLYFLCCVNGLCMCVFIFV